MIQIKYFLQDIKRLVGRSPVRIIQVLFSRIFWGLFLYRFERLLFSLFIKYYKWLRIPLSPIFFLLQAYSNIEIHYSADIKSGLLIHHASAGIVISGRFSAGNNLTLTGGNVIGIKRKSNGFEFSVGNNVYLGANATNVGPIRLGSNIRIGSLCCVTKSFEEDNISLIGVPARQLQ
jgi:serine acetyltransferase